MLVFLGFLLLSLLWLVWTILIMFWPVTLLIVGCVLWRGQMRHWFAGERATSPIADRQAKPIRNAAFEEYRQATLRRVDEESGKFREFLERLRKSRDRDEFDRFMAERRTRPSGGMAGDAAAV